MKQKKFRLRKRLTINRQAIEQEIAVHFAFNREIEANTLIKFFGRTNLDLNNVTRLTEEFRESLQHGRRSDPIERIDEEETAT